MSAFKTPEERDWWGACTVAAGCLRDAVRHMNKLRDGATPEERANIARHIRMGLEFIEQGTPTPSALPPRGTEG